MASTHPADNSESSLAGAIWWSLSSREIGVCTKGRFDRRLDGDYRDNPKSILVNTVGRRGAKMLNASHVVYRFPQEVSAL
jgi:hypothetical protein